MTTPFCRFGIWRSIFWIPSTLTSFLGVTSKMMPAGKPKSWVFGKSSELTLVYAVEIETLGIVSLACFLVLCWFGLPDFHTLLSGVVLPLQVDGGHAVFLDHADPEELCRCLPCLMHGDEGVGHRRKPVLQLLWGPLLRVGLGATDRLFLVTTCPHKYYSGYNEGTAAGNQVIDRLVAECARSACKSYYQGIPTRFGTFRLVFLGLAGDHPFQTKVCGSLRSHLRTEICPWCHANTSNIPFEDFARSAAWRRTVFQSVPWKSSSPFAILPGGSHPSFIKWDLMHMVPHGCARNFCASVVCMLCGPLGLISPMPGPGLRKDRCLEAATRLMDSWLIEIGVGKSMRDLKELTPENLQWKLNRDFPDSSCKASDCILLAQWLLDLIGTMPWQMTEPLQMAYEGLQGLDNFQRLCYTGDRLFMNPARQVSARDACATFLQSYTDLAAYWNGRGWCLFGILSTTIPRP